MKHLIGTIAIVVLLLGILAVATGCGSSAATTLSNNPSPTATQLTTTKTTDFNGVNSASSESTKGLSLSLSLDSTTYQPGQQVSIVIDEKNTLSATNNVSASHNWPLEGLTLGPCGTLNYPFGMSIFQGYYSSADISTAVPLMLYKPGAIYHCPIILSEITDYDFQPMSDIAAIFGSCTPSPCLTTEMNAEVNETVYWTGSSPTATLTNFTPGVYTIVAGDEWGTLVVVHFTVSQ